MEILLLGQQEMDRVFTMADAVQADKDAMAAWSARKTVVPLRISFRVEEHAGYSQYMPAYDPEAGAVGLKIVSDYPKNRDRGLPVNPSLVVMVNVETGEPQALLDGTHLTRVRTGALSGAATDVLANPDCRKFALFGAGGQAYHQLEAVLTVRPMIEEVAVYTRSVSRTEAFVQQMGTRFAGRFAAKFLAACTPEEAVRDADIVTAVTTSPTPVFPGELLKPGAHVNAVGGSFSPDTREIDEQTVLRAGRVTVDTKDGALSEVGDLLIPIREGKLDREEVCELGEIINGKAVGRRTPEEITLFKTVGFGGLDVVTGKRMIERAKSAGYCRTITL